MTVVRLDEQHNGTQIETAVGNRLEVLLPETATTGYQWEVDDPGDAVVVESSETVPAGDMRPGAAGQRRVVLRAARPGSARVSLRLRRSWEPPEKSEATYGVDVRVT
jgi:predicted secreted protein